MATTHPRTVGEKVDRDGPCLLMALVVELAEAHGRIPVKHWVVDLGDDWMLEINGTPDEIGGIPPWNAVISHDGLAVVMFDAASGSQLQGAEDAAIEALRNAIQSARRGTP